MNLQEIRARQALDEIGDQTSSIKVYHREDVKTVIGIKEFKLLFPKFMLKYDNMEKDINFLFIGLITPSRDKFLAPFRKERGTFILNSMNGRNPDTKGKDESYFRMMARAKFVLCPDGDFTWTYRFFESVIFRAIPIIENLSPLYNGYYFFRSGNGYQYDIKKVEMNMLKIMAEMFLG